MKKETKELIDKLVKRWDEIKLKEKIKSKDWGSNFTSPIGNLFWDNPAVIWVFVTHNPEDYEGSQTQIGITKDGKIMWEYQSHCSCDGYGNSDADSLRELTVEELSKKSWELREIPEDWEEIVSKNLEKLLA